MQTTIALVALATVASAAIGGSPSAPPPPGCSTNYNGDFQISIVNISSSAASKVKRQSTTCGQAGLLTANLKDGVLKDSQNRQGEIVANYQFQFDDILQPGAVYTSGFSVCNNGSLAIGGTNVFFECETFGGPGIGNYSNLYSQSTGPQCNPILIDVIPCAGSSSSAGGAPVSQVSDGQPQGTAVAPKPVSQISDGQIQATATGVPVSQIADGQIQATGAGQPPVSQISDGQIQATGAGKPPVSQISDGQIQATGAGQPPVSQISDGQIQATGAGKPPVSQISDGQIQATATASRAPVSQISDGQIQATTLASKTQSLPPVSQISDGQIQATGRPANATSTPVQVSANLASGMTVASSFAALMVGAVAVLLL